MLNGLDKLPVERAEYYKRLHDSLIEINFKAVNERDWQTVIDAANQSLRLQLLLDVDTFTESQIGKSNAVNIALSIIENYCRTKIGWC